MNNKLRDYLDNNRVTRLKFSARMEVDPSMVYKWLRYKSIPSAKHAHKMDEITKGEVPLTYWGYWQTDDGKIVRLARRPLEENKKFIAAAAAYKAKRDEYL
jgi:hypothetical protein